MAKRDALDDAAEEFVGRIHACAKELRDNYARLWRMELDRKIGKQEGHLWRVLEKGEFDLSNRDLFKLLTVLGLDPERYYSGFFEFNLDLYLMGLERQRSRQARSVKDRLRRVRRPDWSEAELRRRVEGLEQQRLTMVTVAERNCYWALVLLQEQETSEPELECETWGVLAAINRGKGRFSAAAYCLRRAFASSTDTGLAANRACTLQRASYLVADQGDFEQALTVVEAARLLFAEIPDPVEVGKTYVATAILLGKLEQTTRAIDFFESSLFLLPEAAWNHRIAALQGLGLLHARRDQLDQALTYLQRAQDLLDIQPEDSVKHRTGLILLRAEVSLKQGDLETAEEGYRVLGPMLAKSAGPIDVALISLRLLKTLLLAGKKAELTSLLRSMPSLLAEVQGNKIAVGVLGGFIREGLGGAITLRSIDQAFEKLRSASISTKALPLLI